MDAFSLLQSKAQGTILSTSAKPQSYRRSSRLAAKIGGGKKSSLLKAQEIMCKKLKIVRFASKAGRTSSATSTSSLPSPPPLEPDGQTMGDLTDSPTGAREVGIAGVQTAVPTGARDEGEISPPPGKNPGYPLSEEEVQQILTTCGIFDKSAKGVVNPGVPSLVSLPGEGRDGGEN